jgi:hypothetical protein
MALPLMIKTSRAAMESVDRTLINGEVKTLLLSVST